MSISIVPYNATPPMKPWPSLADKAFCLENGAGESLFYYDSSPPSDWASMQKETDTQAYVPSREKPVFVLIHGLGDEADSWRHLIPLLNAGGYRVLAMDLPGFGRSVTRRKAGIARHTAAVSAFLEAVIPEGHPAGYRQKVPAAPVILAGNSTGAIICEALAFNAPGLVKAIILVDGSIPGGPDNPGTLALLKMLLSRKWYRAYRGDPEGAWASLRPYYADLDSLPSEDREFLKTRVMQRVQSDTQEKAFFATQRSLIWTYAFASSVFARKIQVYEGKILLIWGGKDRIIPISSSKAFMALRNDIKLEIIEGSGHLPHQEKPQEAARIMLDFSSQAVD
jgi:pimeloyl-ACP methyl ester carboxylesterase